MSVRTGDRSEGTLGVLNDIANLGAYTIQICKSEKVFPYFGIESNRIEHWTGLGLESKCEAR